MTEELKAVLVGLVDREPLFNRKELGTNCEDFEGMTAADL